MELREKFAAEEAAGGPAKPVTRTQLEADVSSALINLGYDNRLVERAIDEARRKAGATDFEGLLRSSLQLLAAGKTQKAAG